MGDLRSGGSDKWGSAFFLQALQLQVSLREAESQAEEASMKLAEVQSQLEAERALVEAAVRAAGGAERSGQLAERLEAELRASKEEVEVGQRVCLRGEAAGGAASWRSGWGRSCVPAERRWRWARGWVRGRGWSCMAAGARWRWVSGGRDVTKLTPSEQMPTPYTTMAQRLAFPQQWLWESTHTPTGALITVTSVSHHPR